MVWIITPAFFTMSVFDSKDIILRLESFNDAPNSM